MKMRWFLASALVTGAMFGHAHSTSAAISQYVQTTSLDDVSANSTQNFTFTDSSGFFSAHFNTVYGGTGVANLTYTYNAKYFDGDVNHNFVSDAFSENTNFSKGFIGFLGVDAAGNATNAAVGATEVALIHDLSADFGSPAVGLILADYSATTKNTTFTIVNSSSYVFDPPYFGVTNPFPGDVTVPTTQSAISTPEPTTVFAAGLGMLAFAVVARSCRKAS